MRKLSNREMLGLVVIAVVGFYLYQESHGAPDPPAAPQTRPQQTAPSPPAASQNVTDLFRTRKEKALDGPMPSGSDPAYLHPETYDFIKPNIMLRPSARAGTASPADAPTQCGPYFIYYHPSYFKGPKPRPTRIITVSKTPPDWDVESVFQLWAFEIKRTHENSYPTVERGRYVERTDVRPVQFAEALGMYVAGHTCKPYKPLTLTCSKSSPWC